jgi:site-specific DNA recombinase
MLDNDQSTLKYCLYARKSSESDERQAMSIDSQIKEMTDLAQREGLVVVETKYESKSAKESGQRDTYNGLLSGLKDGKFNAILTWAPDRLSRNAGDLGSIVDLMDQKKLLQIRTFSQTFGNNPNEKFLLMILCSQAKLENDNRGINVKRGIRAKCEMGWRPGTAPIGYMNRAFNGVKDIIPDPERAPIVREIFSKTAQGWSGRRIKDWADSVGFDNKSGAKVSLSQIYLMLNNTFYHGEFEFPEDSGKVYQGAHEPLITKALFEQIQQAKILPQTKAAWGSKQFAFKEILKCGSCGASITAEEKFKARVDGGLNRHVYYRCTKQVDPQCPERSINEQDLNDQIINFIANNSDSINVTDELARKIVLHTEIVENALNVRGVDYGEIDPLTEYSRYVLTVGNNAQRQKLIEGIKSTFMVRNRQLEVV